MHCCSERRIIPIYRDNDMFQRGTAVNLRGQRVTEKGSNVLHRHLRLD
jgi:hypothetical protein